MTLTVPLISSCDLLTAASVPAQSKKSKKIKLNISFMAPTSKIQINSIKMHIINGVKITKFNPSLSKQQ
jgi:hypothetical protein